MQPRVLLDGLAMPESPRWHGGRLWFSNWGTRQIVAVDLDGNSEVVGDGPDGLGWATNWLPDGRILITGPELIRVEPDGSRVRHADLSHISPLGWSEITGRSSSPSPSPRASPPSTSRTTAPCPTVGPGPTGLVGPDGICLDADGRIWASSANMANDCARIREGGEVLERIDLGRPCFATMLGGPDRRTPLVSSELRERGDDPVAVDLPSEDDSAGWWEYADTVVQSIAATSSSWCTRSAASRRRSSARASPPSCSSSWRR